MVSQASAPANVAELAAPWSTRAAASATALSAVANITLAIARTTNPPRRSAADRSASRSDRRRSRRRSRPRRTLRAGVRPGLGEVVLLGVRRDERGDRAEQHRVHEHRCRDEEPESPHASRIRARKNAPSRWPPRPTSRLTAAEATADRRAINLGCSVLGARRNLHGSRSVSTLPASNSPQNAY